MVQSVELLLAPALERHVLGEWQQLIAAGLPSQGRHTGASNRPHITLAVAQHLSSQDEGQVATVAAAAVPLRVRLDGLLIFGAGPFVLARAVVATVELLALQQRVLQASLAWASRHQEPGHWTAHVTLARRLDAAQLGAAVAAVSPVAELAGEAVAVRRWDGDRKVDWLVS